MVHLHATGLIHIFYGVWTLASFLVNGFFFNTFHNNLFGLVYLMTIMFAFRLSVAKVNTNAHKEEGELNCNRKIPRGEEKGDGSSQDWFQADWLRE